MKRALSLAVVAVAALAVGGCKSNSETDHLRVTATQVNGKPGFSVATVTITKGDTVDLRVDNDTEKAHGFSVDAFDIHRVVEPHTPQELKFKATKSGTFRIYCQLHPAHQPAELLVLD
jgi:nitrosocyanin